MKVSDAIAEYLVKQGVTTVFGYQGGSITHMIDSFDRYGIDYVQAYNEQGAGLAADAYARVKETEIGVAIGTNGPGATNLITAIANAYCDSVPVLFFTGQVHSYAMKRSENVRQESFQEIDIISMIQPITKYAVTILNAQDAICEIDKAIQIALNGRKGPVLIDIPVDIQGENIDCKPELFRKISVQKALNIDVTSIVEKIYKASKPLIIAGGGIRSSGSACLFNEFVNTTNIPVVSSLMGIDSLPHNNPNFVGYIGTYGNRYSNYAIQNADLILAIGTRLDVRQTGKKRELFASNAEIVHIDIDDSELGHFFLYETQLKADIYSFLQSMLKYSYDIQVNDWKHQIDTWKSRFPDEKEFNEELEINPNLIVKAISDNIPNRSLITCDVGQNQMWIGQSLRVNGKEFRILNSGGLGTMGYSLPASIGAFFARPDMVPIAFMGDGGFQMNIQELQMISYYHIPIKIVVFKNNALGLIRDIHEKYYNKRYVGSVSGFSVPPLDRIASAYNLHYLQIIDYNVNDMYEIFRDNEAWLIEIALNGNTYVRPELIGMKGLDQQSPSAEERL